MSFGTPKAYVPFTFQPMAARNSEEADLDGGTALHFAAFYGRARSFSALVTAGADLDALTATGRSVDNFAKLSAIKQSLVSSTLLPILLVLLRIFD